MKKKIVGILMASVVLLGVGVLFAEPVQAFTHSWLIKNADFESVDFTGAHSAGSPGVYYVNQDNMGGWQTDSPTELLEVWQDPNGSNVPAYSGTTFIELNAQDNFPVYQEIQTIPGMTLYWAFAHRGRSGVDVADLLIGAPGSETVIQRASDDNDVWGHYAGTYVVPAGQTLTRLTFAPISTASGTLTTGNFLDDVELFIDVPGADIGDYVWYDTNGNGIQEINEPPATDITVDLLNSNNNIVTTMQTNNLGGYLFTDLLPGTYNIQVHLPPGAQYRFTKMNQGNDPTLSSKAEADGRINNIVVRLREHITNFDAGIITVGDALIEKNNADAGVPLAGASFDIFDSDAQRVAQVISDSDGLAVINELPVGTYTAVETAAPAGFALDPTPKPFTINFNQTGMTIVKIDNYLLRGTLIVHKVDAADQSTPLADATFSLAGSDGNIKTMTTNRSGVAEFEGLLPGTYVLVETAAPNGYELATTSNEIIIPDNPTLAVETTITNTAIALPATGQNNLFILITGGAIIVLSIIAFRRK